MIKCRKCLEEKEEKEFYPSRIKKSDIRCKLCINKSNLNAVIKWRESEKGKLYKRKFLDNLIKINRSKKEERIIIKKELELKELIDKANIVNSKKSYYNSQVRIKLSKKWQVENPNRYKLQWRSRYGQKFDLVKTVITCACDYPKKHNHHFSDNWREVWKVCPRCHSWVDSFDYGYIVNPNSVSVPIPIGGLNE